MDHPSPDPEITRLLLAWNAGEASAMEQLTPLVHDELRRLARRYLRAERADHPFQTTELVNEAYLRLIDGSRVQWQDRAHFFAISAQVMRRILVDLARAGQKQKRGGGLAIHVSYEEALGVTTDRAPDWVALDDALNALSVLDPRKAQVVEMRFFGGLNVEETAEVLRVSVDTVNRDWRFAKTWLRRELSRETAE
jgi:RNA polymerase sigma factor (TIGR02999 family)